MTPATIVGAWVKADGVEVTTEDALGERTTTSGHDVFDVCSVTYFRPSPFSDLSPTLAAELIGQPVSRGFGSELRSIEGYSAFEVAAASRSQAYFVTAGSEEIIVGATQYFEYEELAGWFARHPRRRAVMTYSPRHNNLNCVAFRFQPSVYIAVPSWLGEQFWPEPKLDSEVALLLLECRRRGGIARCSMSYVR